MSNKVKSISKAVRAKISTWEQLQKFADKDELGNLNHYINKLFEAHIQTRQSAMQKKIKTDANR